MGKIKRIVYSLTLVPLLIILVLFGWFLTVIFEGEKPAMTLQPLPEYLSKEQKFSLKVEDRKRGLRRVKVAIRQGGREIPVFERRFPFIGLLNRKGVHLFSEEFLLDPEELNLVQGRVDLTVRAWDYAMKNGGDGNLSLVEHKMTVDTIPPSISPVSPINNVYQGGACLIVYRTSSDTLESGVYVNDIFFPGFPAGVDSKEGYHVCYFALPHEAKPKPTLFLWARDKAGNISKATFYCHIIRKRFRREKMRISDRFLKKVLPYFSFYPLDSEDTDIKKFLKINNQLRRENHQTFHELAKKTSPRRLWKGPFLRMKNAATMAQFADRRSYYYKGRKVDEQVHLGVDLASLAGSPVQASNRGRVVFAGRLGIYGNTVVLDHGQGLASVYSHLSAIMVAMDQEVDKGAIIGRTGQTGLAGGDHLHFAVMVHGVFVNPIEWWDPHWIRDNITKKLALIRKD
ncbi:MAG: M23 family metallopeptidase [Deltaproteobacteria bacterium]|nr:M23 family metallopeptidase [Deltaproteobacteria bacterium]